MTTLPQAGAKLGLGGHSYIAQLGNDPQPAFEEQCALVATCLDSGIRLFDTTYYQERMALGKVFQTLGRRDEAAITAWNFFKQHGQADELVPFSPYEPDHIDVMLSELQTDYIDILVIHTHADTDKLRGELELARAWMRVGKVRQAALGMVGPEDLRLLPEGHPISYVFAPYNAFNRAARPAFEAAKQLGLATVAMSPFVRGWKFDAIGEDKALVADILLRWVASQTIVDRVIISMRRAEWVQANLRSVARGPLHEDEQARLAGWLARVG